MPRAPKKCATAGCETRVVARTYCDQHKPIGWISGGSSRSSSTAHRKWRDQVLARDGRVCQLRETCCIGTATQADHILSVKARPELEFDIGNGQAVCVPCHKRKTQRESIIARRRAARS